MTRNNRVGNWQRQRPWARTARIGFIFSVAIVFLSVMTTKPAFGQMQGVSSYSDAWGDDNYVYGSGVTDNPYNTYNHTFRAVTTIMSPNGRISTSDTGYSSYATAFVSLEFDENDLGVYTVDTQHYDFCPIVSQEIYNGSTGSAVRTGITIIR